MTILPVETRTLLVQCLISLCFTLIVTCLNNIFTCFKREFVLFQMTFLLVLKEHLLQPLSDLLVKPQSFVKLSHLLTIMAVVNDNFLLLIEIMRNHGCS